MSDFEFALDNDKGFADLSIASGDFVLGNDLPTAALVSLFSNRRATDDELNAYAVGTSKPETNQGLWLDTYRTIQYGSGIWLLLRGKKEPEILSRFEQYSVEALQWMVDDGVAESVQATASYEGEAVVLNVQINRQENQDLSATFDFAWDQLRVNITI